MNRVIYFNGTFKDFINHGFCKFIRNNSDPDTFTLVYSKPNDKKNITTTVYTIPDTTEKLYGTFASMSNYLTVKKGYEIDMLKLNLKSKKRIQDEKDFLAPISNSNQYTIIFNSLPIKKNNGKEENRGS